MRTPMHSVLLALICTGLVATFAGCLPTNNFTSGLKNGTGSDSGAGVAPVANVVTAAIKPPCDQYDPSNPTQGICTSCYQSILSVRCANKTDFNDCIDPSVKANYVTLVNQCISQTVSAGFTCPLTNCSLGQVIDPRTCTCVAPTPNPTSVGGSLYVDVGQTDFGPPVVSAQFPQAGVTGTPFPSPAPAVTPTACIGVMDIPMGILNRGNTVFRLNKYSNPVPSSLPDKESPLTTAPTYLTSASMVKNFDPSQLAASPGNNAGTSINFRTGGSREITGFSGIGGVMGATGGLPSFINTVSGQTSDGQSYGGDGGDQKDAQWTQPGFGARDLEGNVYFSDVVSSTVRVICYSATGLYCGGKALGTVVAVAGVPGLTNYQSPVSLEEGVAGTTAHLNSPHGIAVDSNHNVYIADSGNHVIRVVCGKDSLVNLICDTVGNNLLGAPKPGVGQGKIYTIVGQVGLPAANATVATKLNYPYGIDVSILGSNANIYIAEYQNHAIRGYCMFNEGGCAATNNIKTFIGGTGLPGFLNNGATSGVGSEAAFPTDVKVDWAGNLIYADSYNHVVRAYCFNANSDFCKGWMPAAPKVKTLAGQKGQSGDLSVGVLGTQALITLPNQLVIAKQYSDDVAAANSNNTNFVNFRDNNLIFTEKLLAPGLNNAQYLPAPISGLKGIKSLAIGVKHTCSLTATGTVKCVGDNSNSQIGNAGAGNPQSIAMPVSPLSGAPGTLGGGSNHTCSATGNNSSLQCWGADDKDQLGNNNTANSSTPVNVQGSPAGTLNWTTITGGDGHTCAFEKSTPAVYCWGEGKAGQLGQGDIVSHPTIALAVVNPGGGTFTAGISAGANHTCTPITTAVGNEVYCFGNNSLGQQGDTFTVSTRPKPWFAVVTGITSIQGTAPWNTASGGDHSCAWATLADPLYCWGSNFFGELGIGTISPFEKSANKVTLPSPVASGAAQVALGIHHSCAIIASNKKVLCWGDNSAYQLGNSEVRQSATPMEVVGLPIGSLIDSIYANGNQTCALIGPSATTLVPYCWGDNGSSQLGPAPSAGNASGNVVRILCGDNTAANISTGLCRGVSTPYTIYNLSGRGGLIGDHGNGDGRYARGALFANLYGATYDAYKNLVVSSGGFNTPTKTFSDFSLRTITYEVPGPLMSAKYGFNDSNNLSSYYCLRLKPLTSCDSTGACTCRLLPPTDEFNPNFWDLRSQNAICN